MYRKINKYLIDWKTGSYRKPLILQGARQVGKTYSILAFGREQYANVAYFNFETAPNLAKTFDESIDPNYLIPILSRISGQTIIKDKTLIVFDEVQLCERALTSLKYCFFAGANREPFQNRYLFDSLALLSNQYFLRRSYQARKSYYADSARLFSAYFQA